MSDNGTNHPLQGRSRVVEVDFDTKEIVWQYAPSPVFSMLSLHIAGTERLGNGNILICEGESGWVFEVMREDEICWEWNGPFGPRSRAYRLSCCSGPPVRGGRPRARGQSTGRQPICRPQCRVRIDETVLTPPLLAEMRATMQVGFWPMTSATARPQVGGVR